MIDHEHYSYRVIWSMQNISLNRYVSDKLAQ